MRETLPEAPSVAVTVLEGVVASAVRVNTHDRMSGVPSCWVPSSTQPAGVVTVVATFAVTKYSNWSPVCTVLGTTTEAAAVVVLALTDARKPTVVSETVTGSVDTAVAPSSSVTVRVTW